VTDNLLVEVAHRCVCCRVEGRVQGVFFRASAQVAATRLGVVGSARNLDDGAVEVIAQGSADTVAALVAWLWQGSKLSRVNAVTLKDVELRVALQDFSIS
jgi:acylphosphatase